MRSDPTALRSDPTALLEYAFSGAVLPDSNDDYQFSTGFTSTAAGSVTFQPRRLDTGELDHGVFLNAFEIEVIPLPGGAWVGLVLFGMAGVGAVRRKLRGV